MPPLLSFFVGVTLHSRSPQWKQYLSKDWGYAALDPISGFNVLLTDWDFCQVELQIGESQTGFQEVIEDFIAVLRVTISSETKPQFLGAGSCR